MSVPDSGRRIRVLLVDDSPLVLAVLSRVIEADPGLEVVGTAENGARGLEEAARLRPDVVCTDLHMPVMGGLEFTRRLMDERPVPILVVSVSVHPSDTESIFELLGAGAVDVFPKPAGGFQVDSAEADALRRRIRLVAGVKVFRRRAGRETGEVVPSRPSATERRPVGEPSIVAIGGSTGGPRAFATILGELPPSFPLPILGVQHMSTGFTESFVAWLKGVSGPRVQFAIEGDRPEPGVVYFPPEGRHLTLDGSGRLQCRTGRVAPPGGDRVPDAQSLHTPSVDTLFFSLAGKMAPGTIAVLLSGMGADGARGMAALHAAGALTIVQDEATSVVFGMPGEAVRLGAADKILPVEAIGPYLAKMATRPGRGKA